MTKTQSEDDKRAIAVIALCLQALYEANNRPLCDDQNCVCYGRCRQKKTESCPIPRKESTK